ncbi:hypothetical protein ACQZ5N_03155 [Agrobacterium sp. 22-221-1]|uniref:hypothetical protein n=1 Tax=Agrobacterium tumefaciens TaxID=358 RepID=UPI001296A107|nr:hypothetical protein [Agrobacterium tumefaciens]MQB37599.1 hypothetical protein [Agrobacterium tumefaciens]
MLTSRVVRKVFVKVPRTLPGPQRVKVGFPAGEADADNIQKAIWNEFGTRGGASGGGWGGPIPERPFMRNAMRANQIRYVTAMRSSASKIVRGETTLHQTMQKLGIFAQGHIQQEITSLSSPPNSPVTIEIKGSSNPLIDSGEMRAAVTFKADNS